MIVEPVSNGLGSDCFAIVWDGSQLHGLNASGTAPNAWSPEYFAKNMARMEMALLTDQNAVGIP